MPSCQKKKGRFLNVLKNRPRLLGIINHTAQWPLCRARHNGYFQLDVPMNTPLSAGPAVLTLNLVWSNTVVKPAKITSECQSSPPPNGSTPTRRSAARCQVAERDPTETTSRCPCPAIRSSGLSRLPMQDRCRAGG
jgi:hypothetical protein